MSDTSSDDEGPPNHTVVSWNANGLVSRGNYNKDQLVRLLQETGEPDVLCLQEVRLKAVSPTNRGTPLDSDYKSIKGVMETTVFSSYQKFWSLADKKYAGTLTLLHRRLRFPKQDAAYSTDGALGLLLDKYSCTRQYVGIPAKKGKNGASTGAGSPPPKKKQATMTSFFASKPSASKKNGNPKSASSTEHQEEGRFQFFAFPNFDLINTYVPNNGTKGDSFQRRRDWDQDMNAFFKHRAMILKTAGGDATNRPLLWCGDMNVAKEYRDGTHWQKTGEDNNNGKGSNSDEPGIYEWWKDESQCFASGAAKKLDLNRKKEDRGMPSFTTNERRRFGKILEDYQFSDVWRGLHPNGDDNDDKKRNYKSQWDRPNWTWRGHLSKDGNSYQNKYQGKGQRLDYFLLSPSSLVSSVVDECEILGYGERREGLYCGSDHCAIMLKLKKKL